MSPLLAVGGTAGLAWVWMFFFRAYRAGAFEPAPLGEGEKEYRDNAAWGDGAEKSYMTVGLAIRAIVSDDHWMAWPKHGHTPSGEGPATSREDAKAKAAACVWLAP